MFCPGCGAKQEKEEAKFCTSCGAPIKNEATYPAPVQVVPAPVAPVPPVVTPYAMPPGGGMGNVIISGGGANSRTGRRTIVRIISLILGIACFVAAIPLANEFGYTTTTVGPGWFGGALAIPVTERTIWYRVILFACATLGSCILVYGFHVLKGAYTTIVVHEGGITGVADGDVPFEFHNAQIISIEAFRRKFRFSANNGLYYDVYASNGMDIFHAVQKQTGLT